jgi:glutamate formiminotransferase/formiminotetrahydrofolate cyclodeaminase
LELAAVAAAKGNVNSVSDAGVAAEMARAAAHGAALNVRINLGGLKDASYVAETQKQLAATDQKLSELYRSVESLVEEKM